MKTKFLLPVLAMIIAIGMSFASVDKVSDLTQDYILVDPVNNIFMPLGTEVNCGEGSETCWVRLEDGTEHEVYDAEDISTLKKGDGEIKDINP